jgi:hypothetical protein
MSKRFKPIPEFSSEAGERAFWESPKNDSTEYVDWSKAKLWCAEKAAELARSPQTAHRGGKSVS